MNARKFYDIPIVGLKPGVHNYEFEITDEFFKEEYGTQEFENCKALVKVELERNASVYTLKFDVGGTVDVICDRCGNTVLTNLWDEFNVMVKVDDNADELNENEEDPDIFYISRTESTINVATWIYEFIVLSIPNIRECVPLSDGSSGCNPDVLNMLEDMKKNSEPKKDIWKGLDNLKGLN